MNVGMVMEDFVPFDLAVKLKEKGFSCEYPFAIYDEDGEFFTLYSSDKYYFEIENFDDRDFIAPTISQVLKWLREEKLILIGLSPMQEYDCNEIIEWCCTIFRADKQGGLSWQEEFYYQSYEQSALAGVNYCLDNLI